MPRIMERTPTAEITEKRTSDRNQLQAHEKLVAVKETIVVRGAERTNTKAAENKLAAEHARRENADVAPTTIDIKELYSRGNWITKRSTAGRWLRPLRISTATAPTAAPPLTAPASVAAN